MTRLLALWRARIRLASYALTRYLPIRGADDDPPAADPPAADPPPERTFTQAEYDRGVQERLARERKKYEGADEWKRKAEQFDQLQDSQKSELQKAQERADKAEQAAAKRTATADGRLVQAAVLAEATRQRAIKPEHLHKLIETNQVTVGDDGQVTGAEEAVTAFLEANPEYVGSTRPNGAADLGARTGPPPAKGSFDEVIRERAGR